jgi:hypothetical protein
MKKNLLFGLLFLVSNLLIGYSHILLFQSTVPFAAFGSLLIHAVLLIVFPYSKTFKVK